MATMKISAKRLRSVDSPKKLDLSWVPTGMDRSSACRVAIRVPAYVEFPCEEYHVTSNSKMILDKDTTNWVDSITTPPRQLPALDLHSTILNNSPGTPLTRLRRAHLLAANHQEIHLTSSPGSPLTRAKKALLLGT